MLYVICYMLYVICYMLYIIYYILYIIYYILYIIYYILYIIYYILYIIYYILYIYVHSQLHICFGIQKNVLVRYRRAVPRTRAFSRCTSLAFVCNHYGQVNCGNMTQKLVIFSPTEYAIQKAACVCHIYPHLPF